jgi:hypothetical protein
MGLIVVPADEYCVGYVLTHLRSHCLKEMCATRVGDIEHRLQEVYDTIERARWAQLVRVAMFATDGPSEPIAIAIAYRVAPAVAEFQSFSTDLWDLIALPFVRWFKREVVPVLVQNRINVAEAQILCEGPAHYRWWQMMGMHRTGDPLPCGVNGELYQRMVWIREDLRNVRHRQGVLASVHAAGDGRSGSGANPAAGRHPEAAERPIKSNGCIFGGGGGSLAGTDQGDCGIAPRRPAGVR